ncbi:hypothetical protein HKX69_34245 [Streptomyces argyrophyllae]|uniref:Uncharacterized protein n=1 Tax=Streptomyces argyrophylli TaxID=2726118 RepID=A0A6M4PRV1_9ACTN|nr:hypothetical protein [Streptomyces argyrophyllae]QJS13928.1 hypothetical protein HKX69_34245 [Streptomyces argyrophyllae]
MTSSPHPATSRPDWSFPGDRAAISAPAAIALFLRQSAISARWPATRRPAAPLLTS